MGLFDFLKKKKEKTFYNDGNLLETYGLFKKKGSKHPIKHDNYQCYYKNGDKMIECRFEKGEMKADSLSFWEEDGSIRRCNELVNGQKHGTWVEVWGTILSNVDCGNYIEGRKDGEWVTLNLKDMSPYRKGTFHNGARTGEWYDYFDGSGGQIERMKPFDSHGRPNGIGKTFYRSGQIKEEIIYRDGDIKKITKYDEHGYKVLET